MSQTETGERQTGGLQTGGREVQRTAEPGGDGRPAAWPEVAGQRPADDPPQAAPSELPPGQYVPGSWPVLHYGPIPVFNRETWDLRVVGETESGAEHRWDWPELAALPRTRVVADFHCVTKFTIQGVVWEGIAATEVLRAVPPASAVTHVMIWADFGYSANIRIADFAAEDTVLATRRDGAELGPEHGYPLRLAVPSLYAWKSVKWVRAIEYLTKDRRGFWEEPGYHNTADPWREQRYSYQEMPGEGPPV